MDKIRLFNDKSGYTQEGKNISRDFFTYLRSAEYFSGDYNIREMAHLLILEVLGIESKSILDESYSKLFKGSAGEIQ